MCDQVCTQYDEESSNGQNGGALAGLSRRQVMKLLVQGSVAGVLAEVGLGATPAHAQETFLPSMRNGETPAQGDLCDDDAACLEEDCCISTTVLDLTWFRKHAVEEILPKWLAAVTPQGLFLPHFDRQWRPLNRNFGTLVSQCRLLYNFAQGYALTNDPVYRNAVVAGANYLLTHFRDTKYGGWYWSCNLDGTVRERVKECYGHAFVVFGLAHAYQCTGDSTLQEAMLQAWEVLRTRFRDSLGGFNGRMTEDFTIMGTTKSQNPVMHIFEALLAAGTVGGQAQLHLEARTLGNFVFDKLVRAVDRRLPELFDLNWKEIPTNADGSGGQLVIGHAFEWAYLAAYAAELGFPVRFLAFANGFLTYAMALGMDWSGGGTFSPAKSNGELFNQQKGWWEQTEAIRALTHFYIRQRRNDLNGPLQRTLEFVKASLIDPQYGGWYQRVGPGVTTQAMEKGNEWKVDYHVIGMCMEAIRLTEPATGH